MKAPLSTIYLRDNKTCWLCYCYVDEDSASLDHVLPRSMGGSNAQVNLRLAHKWCNSVRGNAFPGQLERIKGGGVKVVKRATKKKPYQIEAAKRRERIRNLMERIRSSGQVAP